MVALPGLKVSTVRNHAVRHVRGDVIAFVEGAQALQQGHPTSHPDLACFDSWTEVEAYAKTEEGEDLILMVRLIKEFSCEPILKALREMVKEEDADLVISTAHKSKGREWDTVRLAADFPTADKMGDADLKLLYVAATRARLSLDVSECPPFCGGQGEDGQGAPVINIDGARQIRPERATCPDPTVVDGFVKVMEVHDETVWEPAQKAASTVMVQNTWSKWNDGRWLVRGAKGQAGTLVMVTRKNGSTSYEQLKSVVWENGEAAMYEVEH